MKKSQSTFGTSVELTDNHSQICSDLIDYCLNKVNHTVCPCIVLYKCCILVKLFSACTYLLLVSWSSQYTSSGEACNVHVYFVYILDLQGDLELLDISMLYLASVDTKIAFHGCIFPMYIRMCMQVCTCE